MSDLVGNPKDRFSHNEAHIVPLVSCGTHWGVGKRAGRSPKHSHYFNQDYGEQSLMDLIILVNVLSDRIVYLVS